MNERKRTETMNTSEIFRFEAIRSNLQRSLEVLEGLCPAGSIPASCCQTRGAGLETNAVTNSDTASPLPDQGWVAPVMAVRDQMLKEAEAHRKMAEIESNPVTFMERRRHYEGAAAGLVAYASLLEEAVGVIRTQSVADGDESCHACHGTGGVIIAGFPTQQCPICSGTGSRKERSVSGNAIVEARRDKTPPRQ